MDIRAHTAVHTDASGVARLIELRVRGRDVKAVRLNGRNADVIGYPVRLEGGRWMIPSKFIAVDFHGAMGRGRWFAARGRIVKTERAARNALAKHPETARIAIREATRGIGVGGHGHPAKGEVGAVIEQRTRLGGYGETYYASADGKCCYSCRLDYDWPPLWATIQMPPKKLKALLSRIPWSR